MNPTYLPFHERIFVQIKWRITRRKWFPKDRHAAKGIIKLSLPDINMHQTLSIRLMIVIVGLCKSKDKLEEIKIALDRPLAYFSFK